MLREGDIKMDNEKQQLPTGTVDSILNAQSDFMKFSASINAEQIAKMIGAEEKDVVDAMEAKWATQTTSLSVQEDEEGNTNTLSNYLGVEDKGYERIELKQDLKNAMSYLEDNERKVIYYRYMEDMTQTAIAKILGVSQMQISRLEKSALGKIRQFMEK